MAENLALVRHVNEIFEQVSNFPEEVTENFSIKRIPSLSSDGPSILRILFRAFDGFDGKRFFITLRTRTKDINLKLLVLRLEKFVAKSINDPYLQRKILPLLNSTLREQFPDALISATFDPSNGREDTEKLIEEGVAPEYYHSTTYANQSVISEEVTTLKPLENVCLIAGKLDGSTISSINQYLTTTCGLTGTEPFKLAKGGGVPNLSRYHGVVSSLKHFYPSPDTPFKIVTESVHVISGPTGVLCLSAGIGFCHKEIAQKILMDSEMNSEMHKHPIMTVTRIIEHVLESNEAVLEGLELIVDWLFELAFRDKLTHNQALEYFSQTYCSLGAIKKAHLSLHHIFAGLDSAVDAEEIFHSDSHDTHSIKTAKEYVTNLSSRASEAIQKLEGAKGNYDRHRDHVANANMLKLTIAIGATVGPMLMDFYFGKQNQTAMLIGAIISIAIMIPTVISWLNHRYGKKWGLLRYNY